MIEEPIKYIKKVEIQGLFGRYDIEWNLHPDVNVLAGINGSGKSTILNSFLELSYSISLSIDSSLKKFKSINISLDNNKTYKFNPYIAYFESYYPNIIINLVRSFDAPLQSSEILQKTDKEIITELDFELWLLQREYAKYQIRIYKYDSEINRDTHIRFLAMIDELFSETQKKVNPNKEDLEFLLGDKEINAYQLSSGEKQLLVILLTVLVQDNKPSILLMDEPEISLHIEWQRKLIQYVRELNPNAQVIVATHSPDIVPDGCLDKIFNLQDLIVKDNLVP